MIMGWLWGIGFIALMILIFWFINKVGRDLIRVIIYILTIPLWIGAMIYYNDIRAYILLGGILAFDLFNIYVYGESAGWWKKRSKKDVTKTSSKSNEKHPTQENRIFCRKCGKQIPADSMFCDKCGTQIVK